MDEAPPPSVFAVVSYGDGSPCSISILQLDTQGSNPDFAALLKPRSWSEAKRRLSHPSAFGDWVTRRLTFSEFVLHAKGYVAHFGQPKGPAKIQWVFSHPKSSTSTSTRGSTTSTGDEDLYLLPYWDPQEYKIDADLHGFVFNLKTKMFRRLSPPLANKIDGHVANLDGYLYFIAQPYMSDCAPHPSFEGYDTANDNWETLQPFPSDALPNYCHIVSTAVWYDDDTNRKILLFNMSGIEIWAYLVAQNKWHPVEVVDNLCYSIVGEAVVLENTIYALTAIHSNSILALSIGIIENDGCDFVLQCRLLSQISVEGMEPFSIMDASLFTRHLCHLGEDNFCLVESCHLHGYYEYQPIRITNIKLKKEDKSMTVTTVCGHLLPILDGQQFHVNICFSLPDSNTPVSKEDQCFAIELNPFPKGFDPHKKNRNIEPEEKIVTASEASTSLVDGAASGRSKTDEGHFIQVRNIPPSATCHILEEVLKKFGPIEDMKVIIKEGGEVSAIVEFESATSTISAIQASPIVIAGHEAVIELEDKRLPV